MSVIYGLENVPKDFPVCAVAVGVFDGVHWGHRAIFKKLIDTAKESGMRSVALTFDKHPTELLAPTRAPYYINTLDQRVELISALGVDDVVVTNFNPYLASLEPEDFVRNIIKDALHAKHVVVGSNFRFGKNRAGDTRYLTEKADSFGLGIDVVTSVIINGGPVSSTRIRALISGGQVEDAAKLLSRRFALRGTVVIGEQIGRTIGFPTANIQTAPRQLIPASGVYAVELCIGNTLYDGVCNIGCRPTFSGEMETVEVHISGFQGNIYGETLDVCFIRRLRDEMTFESPEHLAEQIRKDLERACGQRRCI